jgi:hypothetical protein
MPLQPGTWKGHRAGTCEAVYHHVLKTLERDSKDSNRIYCFRGCDIVVNDVNQELAESVAKEIESMGRKSIAVKADISKPEEVLALYRR